MLKNWYSSFLKDFTSETHFYHSALPQCFIYAILISMAKTKTATKPKTPPKSKAVKTPPKKAQEKAVSKPIIPSLPPIIKCSFCGKSKDTARRIIAGPPPDNAFICDECLFVCIKILFEENPKETYKDLTWLLSSLNMEIKPKPKKEGKKPNA